MSDPNAIELGVKFRADQNGTIAGVRFYKGATNTGTHVGNLWSATGTLLATATFSGETSSGWQQVNFPAPVAVTANTTYVASYHTNAGNYSITGAYFASAGVNTPPLHALATGVDGSNGVYAYGIGGFPNQSYNATNYWVDVVFTNGVPDTTPPTVTSVTPANGAAGVSVSATATATFSEPMNPATINTSTFVLRDPSSTAVVGTVSYNGVTNAATMTPGFAAGGLAPSTTYTATISGGSGGVADAAGNPLATNVVWSFTTGSAGGCPCTIWNASATPAVVAASDSSALELGVKFRADQAGSITGLRFYKAATNGVTHVGNHDGIFRNERVEQLEKPLHG